MLQLETVQCKQNIGHLLKVGWFNISIYSIRHDLDLSCFRKSIIHFPRGLKGNSKSDFLNFIQGQTQWKVSVLLLQYLFTEK